MDPSIIAAVAGAISAVAGFLVEALNRRRLQHRRQVEFERQQQEIARYREAMAEGTASRLSLRLRATEGLSLEQRAAALAETLTLASQDLGELLQEMQHITDCRLAAVSEQERKLQELSEREQSLQTRLASLEATRPEVVEEFFRLTQEQQAQAEARAEMQQRASESRSARRDYLLFLAGVVTSVLVAIALSAFGIGS